MQVTRQVQIDGQAVSVTVDVADTATEHEIELKVADALVARGEKAKAKYYRQRNQQPKGNTYPYSDKPQY